jgi:hypothetical protein
MSKAGSILVSAEVQAIVELDLDDLISIEPPRGFGRD